MKLRRTKIKKMFKDKNAVSQILAAMMMIFLFTAAIGVVWGYLYPTYRRFQTTNAINSVTLYMLNIDESIYDIYGKGEGTTKTIRVDPSYGTFFYDEGKNVSLQYSNTAGTFTGSYVFSALGAFSYSLENRRGVILDVGQHRYLKGPKVQNTFFINGSDDGLTYQGLTNLTLSRTDEKAMKIELEYRARVYYWFDQTNNVLSVIINLVQIDINGVEFSFHDYNELVLAYNTTRTVYSTSANIDDDFFIDGSIASVGFNPSEPALTFIKPLAVANYDVNIDVVVSQILFYY
ncbi:MAG: hypothetical protein HZR80_13215 [Candidatus Heimdallarchaeota archaeon]